jgi:hypothetical protein
MMPAVSEKQKKFMDAVAHNKGFAKKVGVPQSVGADFSEASKGMSYGPRTRADSQVANQPKTNHGGEALFKQGGRMATKKMMGMKMGGTKKMAMGGDTTGMSPNKQKNGLTMEKMAKVRTAAPSRDGLAEKGRTKGMMPKMAGNSIGTGSAMMKRGGMAKKMK